MITTQDDYNLRVIRLHDMPVFCFNYAYNSRDMYWGYSAEQMRLCPGVCEIVCSRDDFPSIFGMDAGNARADVVACYEGDLLFHMADKVKNDAYAYKGQKQTRSGKDVVTLSLTLRDSTTGKSVKVGLADIAQNDDQPVWTVYENKDLNLSLGLFNFSFKVLGEFAARNGDDCKPIEVVVREAVHASVKKYKLLKKAR